uniref:Core Histone H2A/H2B/H3 domain-containing protein n=1 Tax=Otolemur garnettii TaxID=30611 RepID=H0XPX5_OTOGA
MTEPYSGMSSHTSCTSADESEAESSTSKKPKQPRRCGRRPSQARKSFATYFPRVLKQVHHGLSLSKGAVKVMDSFVYDLCEQIAQEAGCLARYTNRSTLTTRELQSAVCMLLPGELGKCTQSEATKAVLRYRVRKVMQGFP